MESRQRFVEFRLIRALRKKGERNAGTNGRAGDGRAHKE
jgi:hypothetical protein